ncbi:MAG: hypothetical protein ACI92S_003066 [Planctomycetaceae bacterium]
MLVSESLCPSTSYQLLFLATVLSSASRFGVCFVISHFETPWLTGRVPNGYWETQSKRLAYLDWLGVQCGFTGIEDWYRIRKADFHRNHGGGLLNYHYRDSVWLALLEYRPDYQWIPWRLGRAPLGYWHSVENRRTYMDWLSLQLGFSKREDWYAISRPSFKQNYGAGLLMNHYGDTPSRAVMECFPDFEWKQWLFKSIPNHYWENAEHRQSYLAWLGTRLGLKSERDWQQLTSTDFIRNRGLGLLDFYWGQNLWGQNLTSPDFEELSPVRRHDRPPIWSVIRNTEQFISGFDLDAVFGTNSSAR